MTTLSFAIVWTLGQSGFVTILGMFLLKHHCCVLLVGNGPKEFAKFVAIC